MSSSIALTGRLLLTLSILGGPLPVSLRAQALPATRPAPSFLFAAEGVNKILRYGPDGRLEWEHPAPMSRDAWQLPGGNVLFCYNEQYDPKKNDNPSGVMEVTADHRVVFHFKTTGQVWSCQRLIDGSTLVANASQGKLLIVSPQGQIVREIKLLNKAGHSCLRNARQTASGSFLVAEESAKAVREYDAAGKLLREIKVAFAPYSAVRLEDGQTLICGQQSMVQVDARNKVVWSLTGKDLPELGIRWFAGVQVLPGGNLFICNAGGKVGLLEITRDRRIVWQSSGRVPIGHGIQRLDVDGTPLK